MSQVSKLIEQVRVLAARPEWSKTRISTEIGLSPNALRNLDAEDFNPTASTLEKLENFISKQAPPS